MKVIIIGAGIAGLATALSLQQYGIDYEIFEGRPDATDVGAGIWLAPNGLEVLNRINPELLQEIQSSGSVVDELAVTYKGKPLSRLSMVDIERDFGFRHVTIHRSKLNQLLEKHLKNKVHYNKELSSLKEGTNEITVSFSDGSSATGDIVLGCDGIHSRVRSLAFDNVPIRYSGQTCWRAIVNYKVKENYQGKFYEQWHKKPGLRVGYAPINADQVYIFLTSLSQAGIKSTPETVINELHGLFDDFAFDVKAIIDASKAEDWIRKDIIDFKPLNRWHQGRICLLGDAVHATTPNMGQGGNQALESAIYLAKQLAEQRNHVEAFEAFQHFRKQKTDGVTQNSWQFGKLNNMGQGIMRNLVLGLVASVPERFNRKQLKKQYDLGW